MNDRVKDHFSSGDLLASDSFYRGVQVMVRFQEEDISPYDYYVSYHIFILDRYPTIKNIGLTRKERSTSWR